MRPGKLFTSWVVVCTGLLAITFYSGCARQRSLGASYTGAGGNGPRNPDGGLNPAAVFSDDKLRCIVEPEVSTTETYVDANGNFYPGFAPTLVVGALAGRSGKLVAVTAQVVDFDATALAPGPINSNPDYSLSLALAPLKAGRHGFKVFVSDMPGEGAVCSGAVVLNSSRPPAIGVSILANGFVGSLPVPLSNGQGALVSWMTNLARDCTLALSGGAPAPAPLMGQVATGALVNSSTTTQSFVSTLTCLGERSTETKSMSVTVPVNPNPTATLTISGFGSQAYVGTGGSITLVGASGFATGGCRLKDNGVETGVNANFSQTVNNITASHVYTFICDDQNGGRAQSTARVDIANPSVSITADGVGGSFTKPYRTSATTIAWTSIQSMSCSVAPMNWQGLSGSQGVADLSLRLTTTYTVTCQSVVGPVTDSVDVVVPGFWIGSNREFCPTKCSALGAGYSNVGSPEGSKCMSGESRPRTAINAGFGFPWGCWSNCSASDNETNSSDGGECYRPGQKKDHDRTDRTSACHCKKT